VLPMVVGRIEARSARLLTSHPGSADIDLLGSNQSKVAQCRGL
jgi:hypothetical protein